MFSALQYRMRDEAHLFRSSDVFPISDVTAPYAGNILEDYTIAMPPGLPNP